MRFALFCVASAVLLACGGPQIQQRVAADLSKLGPATLEARQPKEGEPRSARVRVYADAGVRALPQWKEKITEQIDYASQLLTPLLGAQLKVLEIREWDRPGDPEDALKTLADADPAKDVAWVIGYVTPNDVASKAMSALGNSELLGKYVVVRAWAEKPEAEQIAMPEVKPAERAEVLAAHERHKQTVVLLHMLAKTLGAIDEADAAWIQNPAYSPKQSTFSDRNRELLQLGMDARISEAADKDIAHELLEKIEKENWGGWIASSRDETSAKLRSIVTASKAGEAAPDIPVAAVEQFDRVKAIAARGDIAAAMTELDNMLTAYPGNPTMYLLKCQLLLAKPGVNDKGTRAACTRAGELAPGDPKPNIAVADALLKAKDMKGARAELEVAATKIKTLKTGADGAWRQLIAMYQGMGSLTWTEQVVAEAKLEKDDVTPQIQSTRARYGVPKDAKFVKPEQEGALVAAVRDALSLVYANKFGEAEKAIVAGERKWPGAPGFLAVRCDLHLRQTQLDQARAACNKALAIDPNESWALYLSGVIAFKDTSDAGTKNGIEKLRRAIAADPDLGQAWRTLGKAYQRAKDKEAFDKLSVEYGKKFGSPLPQ